MHKVLVTDKTDTGKTNQFKQLRKYVYGEFDSPWEAMVASIEKLYPNLSQNIKIKFPNLNENEFRVCILTFAPLSVQDIADILDISVNTVGKIRSNIRKKLQMEKSRGDISEHILKILE